MDLNKCVLRGVLNESSVVEARMWTGRLFQRVGVAIEKVHFPKRVWGIGPELNYYNCFSLPRVKMGTWRTGGRWFLGVRALSPNNSLLFCFHFFIFFIFIIPLDVDCPQD